MQAKGISMEKIILVLLVLVISLVVGWYGEKAAERFMHSNNSGSEQI